MAAQVLEKAEPIQEQPMAQCPLTLEMMEEASEAGYRLEYIAGVGGIWETMPLKRHQGHTFRIQSSLQMGAQTATNGCGCYHYADLSMRFPDGSSKRPDIAVFCVDPEQEDEEVTVLPDAVIEIVSPRYEGKDYNIAVPFYRKWGIPDIVVFNPADGDVLHITATGEARHTSPVELTFACGCTCTV